MDLRQFNICVRTEAPQVIIKSQTISLTHNNEKISAEAAATTVFLVEYSRRKPDGRKAHSFLNKTRSLYCRQFRLG